MTFLDLRKRIAEMLGLNQSDTTTDTFLKEWVNDSYRFIAGIERWPWIIQNDILQTTPDITTGTVSVTNDSAAITFSSGPTPSVAVDFRIQFGDSDDWYDITSHTGGATAATLADVFLGTTNGVQTYILRKVYYDLPDDFDRMTSVRQSRTDVKLEPIDFRFKDKILPDPTEVDEPTFYSVIGLQPDAAVTVDPQYRLVFFPTPNVEMNIDIRYYKRITALSGDTDVPITPIQWHSIFIFDVLDRYGYTFLDDTRRTEVRAVKNEILDQMMKHRNPVPDKVLKKLQWDKAIDLVRLNRIRVDLPIVES